MLEIRVKYLTLVRWFAWATWLVLAGVLFHRLTPFPWDCLWLAMYTLALGFWSALESRTDCEKH